jgi:hypothetical protein
LRSGLEIKRLRRIEVEDELNNKRYRDADSCGASVGTRHSKAFVVKFKIRQNRGISIYIVPTNFFLLSLVTREFQRLG